MFRGALKCRLVRDALPLPQRTFTLVRQGFARQRPWRLESLEDGGGVTRQSTRPN